MHPWRVQQQMRSNSSKSGGGEGGESCCCTTTIRSGSKLCAGQGKPWPWRAKGPEKPIFLEPSFYLLLSYSYEGKDKWKASSWWTCQTTLCRARSSGHCLTSNLRLGWGFRVRRFDRRRSHDLIPDGSLSGDYQIMSMRA